MSQFLLESFRQYNERKKADRQFVSDCKRIKQLLEPTPLNCDDVYFLLLTPLIEVSWVDGRIGRYEQDAILRAAERYRILSNEENFFVLMERLSTRPHAKHYEAWWNELGERLDALALPELAALASHLFEQTKYIAGLGQKQLFGLWRGHHAGADEIEVLQQAEMRIRSLEQRLAKNGVKPSESDEMLKLVPLVDVAWADGRVTKKERKLIFDSFFDLGIRPTSENIQRLLSWLNLSPNGEFVRKSIERLKDRLEALPEDKRAAEKYGLISLCTLVAEASGGTKDFLAGGSRICDEEIVAVKRIAAILNGAIDRGGEPKRGKK